jgi:enoyl-CoA hydratase
MSEFEAPEIIFDSAGGLGRILLNRPQALNALTRDMCIALDRQLRTWERDPAIAAILIRGQGKRAFCAGGDIRRLYEDGRAERYPDLFYRDEYRLNARLHRLAKPYISFLDGIVMGGGVGVSVHGSHRIATENTLFAMPETGIGLFPDVGGSFFLSRCPGALGMYLGLTGARIGAADAIYCGVAQSFVPEARLSLLLESLQKVPSGMLPHDFVSEAIRDLAGDLGSPDLAQYRATIDRCFERESVEAILAALQAEEGDFAARTRAALATKSPTSLKISHRQLRQGRGLSFEECMRMEWRIVHRVIRGHDFYEGTRAAVIDKDNAPAWRPATLAEVTEADIDAYFAPLPGGELIFDRELREEEG